MSKKLVENCRTLTISELRRNDLLPTKDSGPVRKSLWVHWDKDETRVLLAGIRVDTSAGEAGVVYLDCLYPPTGISVTSEVKLVTTTPNYGGVRYWFVCPCYRGGNNGGYCNRRVRKLYLPDGSYEYGCRHCHRLSYADRNVSRPDRDGQAWLGHIARAYCQSVERRNKKRRIK